MITLEKLLEAKKLLEDYRPTRVIILPEHIRKELPYIPDNVEFSQYCPADKGFTIHEDWWK